MKKAVTIKDIAEQLNLSRNTVAKALNGRYVPEKTRERVLEKARQLDYKSMRSNLAGDDAPALRKRILLFSGKPLNNMSFFVPIIKSIENYCFDNSHELFQYTFNDVIMTFSSLANHIKTLDVDGIIAIECFDRSFNKKLMGLGLPVCFIDFSASDVNAYGNYDIISTNSLHPIYHIVNSIRNRYGLSRFCFVGDPTHCLSFQDRYQGMIQALIRNSIQHTKKDDILRSNNFDYGNPEALATEISKLRFMPECFICSNDFIARTVCKALKLLGVEVPKQCFVVGYDNVSDASAMQPRITTFDVDKEFLGAEAMRTLMFRINSPNTPFKKILIASRPVFRESTMR